MNEPASVTLCTDGKYRWVYELPMMKSFAILSTVWKVLGIAFCFPLIIVLLSGPKKTGGDILRILGLFALILLGVMLLSFIAYIILAACFGWKYCVLFEMDENGITHRQMDRQAEKASVLGAIAAAAGAAAGSASAMGAGLLAASGNSCYSRFESVKRARFQRRQHLIKLDYPFSHNQIYIEDDAFDFVADYIRAHCPKLN